MHNYDKKTILEVSFHFEVFVKLNKSCHRLLYIGVKDNICQENSLKENVLINIGKTKMYNHHY